MKNATFRQLRVFNEVARHLSFVRAAENLHLTPPAVTMQVKELEGHVGMPLFDRRGKQVSLTTTGEYMLVYARKILATVKDAEDAAARLQRAETGVLTIGFVSTAKYFLMNMLADFRNLHPGVDIQILIGNRDQLVGMLQNSEVDIAVMGRPPKELQTRAEPFAAPPTYEGRSPTWPSQAAVRISWPVDWTGLGRPRWFDQIPADRGRPFQGLGLPSGRRIPDASGPARAGGGVRHSGWGP